MQSSSACLPTPHCRLRDGSDLPDAVLTALAPADLIVHLGDLVTVALLDRLAGHGAAVIGVRKPTADPPAGSHPCLVDGPVIRTFGAIRCAFLRQLTEPLPDAHVIAYGVPSNGGGHDHRVALMRGSLVVSPGSPNFAVRHQTVALLRVADDIEVEIVHLRR